MIIIIKVTKVENITTSLHTTNYIFIMSAVAVITLLY